MTSSACRAAYVHVGLQKTGTSYLQSFLFESQPELRAAGVRMAPVNRVRAFQLMEAVRGRGDGAGEQVLRAVRRVARTAPEPTVLLTQESLAAATEEQAARLLGCLRSREVHVVVTARDLARQLPSMWQQKVKARRQLRFADYLREVREGGEEGIRFWAQQDLPAVLERWGAGLPPERVHVVTVPPPGADPSVLADRFAAVVGFDFSALHSSAPRSNVGLDAAQVELLRRVNERLELPGRRDRAQIVKQFFAGRILAPVRAAPLRTPRELAPWCEETARRHIAALRSRGYDVVGDLDDLLPRPESFTDEPAAVSDADVLEAAVVAVARLLEAHDELLRAADRLRPGSR